MKKVAAAVIIWAILIFTGSAWADGMARTWVDVYDPVDIYFGGGVESHSFAFDITRAGFLAGEDSVNSYSILFDFRDDGANGDCEAETASITFDGRNYQTSSMPCGSFARCRVILDLTVNSSNTTSLNSNGLLNITIARASRDFNFLAAQLTAAGIDHPTAPPVPDPPIPDPPPVPGTPVPEPASLLLLGLGLAGLAGVGRKMKK